VRSRELPCYTPAHSAAPRLAADADADHSPYRLFIDWPRSRPQSCGMAPRSWRRRVRSTRSRPTLLSGVVVEAD
jgi:hypothetical protein